MVTIGSRGTRAVVIAVSLTALAWGAYTWWPSEERRIRRRLTALAATVNEGPRDGLEGVAHSVRLASFFDAEVVYQFGPMPPQRRPREQLVALVAMDANRTRTFTLSFVDVSVTVNGLYASSHFTALLEWTGANGQTNIDAREATLDWRKTDAWRITKIVAVESMEKPY